MKKRITIVSGVPTPYREPLFEGLADSTEYEISVLYCLDHQPDQPWRMGPPRYSARYLKNLSPAAWHGRFLVGDINPGVWQALREFAPDAVVLYGYNSVTMLLAALWAIIHRIPILMRSDSNLLAERQKAPLRLALKRLLLKKLEPYIAAYLSVGTMNARYWRFYGVPKHKIIPACYAVDNDGFAAAAKAWRSSRAEIILRLGRQRRYQLLYVGRLVDLKRVDVLIDAFRQLSTRRSDLQLTIVGDGPERRSLAWRAVGTPGIHFAGFQDQAQLPKFYGAADLFMLLSENEPWGLVVNEAMASGLPVIATRRVGSARDLVVDGLNGFIVPENDPGALAAAIDRACQNESRLALLGESARRTIQAWNYSTTLAGFRQALLASTGVRVEPGLPGKRAESRTPSRAY